MAQWTVTRGYDAIGSRYREWSSASPVRLAHVQNLLRRLPDGSTVVDLGCGPGEPATRMLARRHRVVGVDLSRVQLSLAQQAAPSAAFVRADMTRFALRAGSVDAVGSFYAFGHLPPASHAPLLRSISQWLRPTGVLVASAPLTAEDGLEADWLGVPMYFGGIGEQATYDAVHAAGLQLDSAEVIPEDEGGGHLARFLWLTATKPAA
jgi:SAM-dependent methyltransferase